MDPRLFDGYKVLLALGGLDVNAGFARVLENYVRGGGTLVLNVEDLGRLDPALFGVSVGKGRREGRAVRCRLDGHRFAEAPFTFRPLELCGAEAVYDCDGLPLVTRHKLGAGQALLVAAHYMVQDEAVAGEPGAFRETWKKKPLLQFTADLMDHLTAGLAPVEVLRREEDKEDLSWLINRKGEGWVVTVFNYSLRREELVARPIATAKVAVEYPYKAVDFQLVCRAPMKDCVEWYDERRPLSRTIDGRLVISDSIRGGEIRVYEFQPRPIDRRPCTRCVNFALNRPVTASSTYPGYDPKNAVDGRFDNDRFWQSGLNAKGDSANVLPQWLQVDLGRIETISHALVRFHVWPLQTPEMRQHICKYTVAVSEDGQRWTTVLDESKNEMPARTEGLERWFSPIKARYLRLTVLKNSALAGAQVVEFQALGDKRETYLVGPERSD
jgi:hypothetical protein